MYHPVFDGVYTPAVGHADQAPAVVEAFSLEDILQREFDFDAFTSGYVLVDAEGSFQTAMPRFAAQLSKEVIRQHRREGANLYMAAAFIDLDRVPHTPWPDMAEARGWVEKLAEVLPDACIYSTSRGLRVVFRLRRLVELENYSKIAKAAMRYVAGAVRALNAPVEVDPSSPEWDRQMRLPYVTRDGQSTSEATYMVLPEVWASWFPGRTLLAEMEQAVEDAMSEVSVGDLPPETLPGPEVLGLAQIASLRGPPALRSVMRKVLEGQAFYAPSERNTQTWKLIARFLLFCSARSALPAPEQVYALLYPSVSLSKSGADTARKETWSMAVRLHAREVAKQAIYEEETQVALEILRDRVPIVVYTDKTRWVWDPERRSFGEATKDKDTLLAEITGKHPAATQGSDGKMLPLYTILRDHGVRVHGIIRYLGRRGSRVVAGEAGKNVLEIGVGDLPKVPAVYHADCEEYLNVFSSGAGAAQGAFLDWLATCCQLESPTTALVLHGAGGAGKDMLALALGQLFGGVVEFAKALQKHNAELGSCGLVRLEEGVDSGESVANLFRAVVGGGEVSIEPKNVDSYKVRGNYRVVTTTNNPRPLPVENSKTLTDFLAIASRVLHVHVSTAGRDWLLARGGRTFTEDWVTRDLGDRTVPGCLAEHIRWLQETRAVTPGPRFLVSANVGDWHVRALLQGILRDVLLAAGRAVAVDTYSHTVRAVDGQVYVCPDSTFAQVVCRLSHTQHENRDVLEAVQESLVCGPAKRFAVGAGEKIFYPLPTDLILPLLAPSDRSVFVEEAETYDAVAAALGRTPKTEK